MVDGLKLIVQENRVRNVEEKPTSLHLTNDMNVSIGNVDIMDLGILKNRFLILKK